MGSSTWNMTIRAPPSLASELTTEAGLRARFIFMDGCAGFYGWEAVPNTYAVAIAAECAADQEEFLYPHQR